MSEAIPCWRDPAAGAWLETMFGREDAPGYSPTRRNRDGETVFCRTGAPAVLCWAYAGEVKAELGDEHVKLAGFWCSENPGTLVERVCDGHDFAIVGGRWLVDGWIRLVEAVSDRVVFDLDAPEDADLVRSLYGDRDLWTIRV